MSNRQTVINYLEKHTVATAEEMADGIGWPERKVRDTVSALKKLGLLVSEMDDVTKKAMHRLATKSKPGAKPGTQNKIVEPQPAVGHVTPATMDRKTRVAGSVAVVQTAPVEPPAEAMAVIEPPKPDEAPVAASSDDIPAPDYDPREVSFNHPAREQALVDQRAILDVALSTAQSEIASLRDRLLIKEEEAEALLDDVRRQVQRALAAEQNRDDVKARELEASALVAEYELMALNQAKTIKAQQAEIETLTGVGAELSVRLAALESTYVSATIESFPERYIVTDHYMLAKSQEEANGLALAIAADNEIDTPVAVFAAHNARELRINWRDA